MQTPSSGRCDRFVAAAFFFAAVGEGGSGPCPYGFTAFPDDRRNFPGKIMDGGKPGESRACGVLSDFSAFFGLRMILRISGLHISVVYTSCLDSKDS